MNTVHIRVSRSYDVLIGSEILDEIGEQAAKLNTSGKVAIISDSNVWPLYGRRVETSLEKAGFQVVHFVFPAGESSKNIQTYTHILNFLAENQVTRSDMIIALGGGVTGDMAGFAAATYLRGIPFIQIPTTLLAMVDSSVGGKTAIDLPSGKNLVGAFYQPSLVLCDIHTLDTLPEEFFRDGCAEVIKYGVLYDDALYSHLEERGLHFDRESVITRCVELKRDVVTEDEFDTGVRMKLNLGHTIGHSVEAKSNFSVSHGQAVAIGMAIVAKATAAYRECDTEIPERIVSVLKKFGLPVSTEYTSAELCQFALSDKKRMGGTVNLIVPKTIGSCVIRKTPVEALEPFIKAGL